MIVTRKITKIPSAYFADFFFGASAHIQTSQTKQQVDECYQRAKQVERLTHYRSQSHLHVCETVSAARFSQYRHNTEVEAIIGDEEGTW